MLTANYFSSSRSNKSKATKITSNVHSSNLDPHLEMALAMSASLQPSETPVDAPKRCWLPQPPPAVKSNKPFKSKAKTALQVRTEEERKNQMLEAVSSVLEATASEVAESTQIGDYRFEAALTSESLLRLQCVKRILWHKSALNSDQALDYYLEVFMPYFHVKTEGRVHKKVIEEDLAESENYNDQSLLKLSKAWNRLFSSGEHSDITVFAREEEKLTAHSLVLQVRCPKLLLLAIFENDNRIISIPEVSAYVLKSFLKLLYTGKLVRLPIQICETIFIWLLFADFMLLSTYILVDVRVPE